MVRVTYTSYTCPTCGSYGLVSGRIPHCMACGKEICRKCQRVRFCYTCKERISEKTYKSLKALNVPLKIFKWLQFFTFLFLVFGTLFSFPGGMGQHTIAGPILLMLAFFLLGSVIGIAIPFEALLKKAAGQIESTPTDAKIQDENQGRSTIPKPAPKRDFRYHEPKPITPAPKPQNTMCPTCNRVVSMDEKTCPYCHNPF